MVVLRDFAFGPLEITGWVLQFLLIAFIALRRDGRIRLPRPTISFCLLLIALGWAFRLAYLFALGSGGFQYWLGDNLLRWLNAWEWSAGLPRDASAPSLWMPGTQYLHGIAIRIVGDPFYGSKLASATCALMTLAGVFVFAQAVFRNRVLSVACVAFLTPFWIDVLLSGGTMAEMPTVGAMLAGAGALVTALRLPPGPRRSTWMFGGGLLFAVATMFHAVAWIQLTGILLFVLPVFLRERHGTLAHRFGAWVIFCLVSTSYCFVWAVETWSRTGSPFTPFREAASVPYFKTGGTTHILQHLSRIVSPWEVALVGFAMLSLLLFAWLLHWQADEEPERFARPNAGQLRTVRWLCGVSTGVLCFLAWFRVDAWLAALPPGQRWRLFTNLLVFPTSLVYCLYYYLPLVAFGLVSVLFVRDPRLPQRRPVLACIVWVLVLLIVTSLNGGANLTPFRTVLLLAAALLPFALAPFFDPPTTTAGPQGLRRPASAWLSLAIVVAVLGHGFVANHIRIFRELPEPVILANKDPAITNTRADAYALGAWIRAEIERPGYLSPENLALPFVLALKDDLVGLKQTAVEYHIGDPERFVHPRRILRRTPASNDAMTENLVVGQVLIAEYDIDDPGLRLIARINRFVLYEVVAP